MCWPTVVYGKIRDDALYFVNYFGRAIILSDELTKLMCNDMALHEAYDAEKPTMKYPKLVSNFSPRKTYAVAGHNIVVDLSYIPKRNIWFRPRT